MSRGAHSGGVVHLPFGAPLSDDLSLPDIQYLPWMDQAKCVDYDPELWYPPRDKDKYKPIADKAKSICWGRDGHQPCPVRLDCLMYVEENEETHGIYGGMSHRERNALKRKAKKTGTTLLKLAEKQTRH